MVPTILDNQTYKNVKIKLCIAPCGKLKVWDRYPNAGPTKAEDVYIGPFARTCIEYAKKFYKDSYVILSDKYGFLFPDEVIPENYDVTFKDPKTNPISVEDLRRQVIEKGLINYNEIEVIGGKTYVDIAKQVFKGKRIITPLQGLGGIGRMISAMKSAIRAGREIR